MKKILLLVLIAFCFSYTISAQCGPGEDTEAPAFGDAGDGTMANPFKNLALATVGSVPSGTYYFTFNGSTFLGELDNDTDGGGWLMVLNYVHLAGDNSELTIRNTDLPLLNSSTLGDNEAGTANWGHMGNALAASIDFEEVRFYAETTGHSRVINFKTTYVNVLNYLKTGSGNFAGIQAAFNHTTLPGHSANIPGQAFNVFSNQGDLALTEFPFWRSGQFHWGIRGLGNRWEVDDIAINTQSTIHRVWVRGDQSPIGTTAITTTLDATGNITINPTAFGLGATDNCSTEANISLSLSQADFTCDDLGSNTVQLTATDEQNNSTTIDVMITILESRPVITTPPGFLTLELDSNGLATIDLAALNITVTDDCAIDTITLSQTEFTCNNTGLQSFVISAADVSGNTTNRSVLVNVTDSITPEVQCVPSFSVALDATGTASIEASDLIESFSDNCSSAVNFSLSQSDFTCADIGDNTITVTVTDPSGNQNTCTTTVTVTVPSCPGNQTLTPDLTSCGVVYNYPCASNITAGPPSGTFLDVGTTTTYTYDTLDNSGATVSCSYEVTVVDTEGPLFTAPDQTLEIPASGLLTLTGNDFIGLDPLARDYTLDQTGTLDRVDIAATGVQVTLGDDDVSLDLPIGFDFAFYGSIYNDFRISSNGFITFADITNSGCCDGQNIPDVSVPNNLIAFDWTDLNPSEGGTIRYETIGTAPNRILILDVDNVPYFGETEGSTTQVKLFETTNHIEIHATSITDPSGDDKTQGLENSDGTAAIPVPGRNAGLWTATNDVVAFIPVSGIIDGCGVDTIVASQATFTCDDVGDTLVTITATDTNGNTTEQTVTITITDPLGICQDISIAPKVFLQGAGVSPIVGEENLMRDDLRTNSILPTTSPYSDALTVDPIVFDTTGSDAIVDWVWVELRDATDRTIVVSGQSALLQRDGDIVNVDGTSPLIFSASIADYHIKINHRSHLGITTATPIALDTMTTAIDFTVDTATTNGGAIALVSLTNGNLALLAGDGNGDGSVLNTDIVNALQASGTSGYLDNDANMDGFILNSDIQLIIQPNAGKIEQE